MIGPVVYLLTITRKLTFGQFTPLSTIIARLHITTFKLSTGLSWGALHKSKSNKIGNFKRVSSEHRVPEEYHLGRKILLSEPNSEYLPPYGLECQ